MIVPSNRLLLYAALIGVPLFTLLGVAEAPMIVVAGVVLLVLLLVALDAPGAAVLLAKLQVELPRVLRTAKGRDLEIAVVVVNPGMTCRNVKVGVQMPLVLACECPILTVPLSGGHERNGAGWKTRAVERGNGRIDRVYLEGGSRLGLWWFRRALAVLCEVRVYPDLSHDRQVLAPLFFRRSAIGMHQVRQIGKGREFEQLRAYAPGDGYEDVYWKGTAKRRFPVTKMFQLERTQEVYVVVDASRRSGRKLEGAVGGTEAGMVAKTQLERFIQAALILALAAQEQADKIGLVVFSDQVRRLIPAGSGRAHYEAILEVLYTLEAEEVSPDFEELFIHIGNRLRHRALLVFLTDLGEPWLAESFVEGVPLVARRHVVLAHMLGQREVLPMFGKGDKIENEEELYERLAGQLMWNEVQETTGLLRQRGVHLTSSTQEGLVADVVSEYLKVKKRQLL